MHNSKAYRLAVSLFASLSLSALLIGVATAGAV